MFLDNKQDTITLMDKSTLNIKTRNEFREWLILNASQEEECFLILKRGRPKDDGAFYYLDAVEEAICFGWIDSISKKVDGVTLQRFSPRKKNSPWSELNKERAKRLIKLGLMTPVGRKMLPKMTFKMDNDVEEALKKARCYSKFKSFPALYQRVRAYNVSFYKKIDKKAYEKALNHLIDQTKKGIMFGEWNDYGRLLNY